MEHFKNAVTFMWSSLQKVSRLHITSPLVCCEATKCEICPAQSLISWIYRGLKWTILWQTAQYYMEISFLHMSKFSKLGVSTTTSLNVSVGCRSVKWIQSWHYITPVCSQRKMSTTVFHMTKGTPCMYWSALTIKPSSTENLNSDSSKVLCLAWLSLKLARLKI